MSHGCTATSRPPVMLPGSHRVTQRVDIQCTTLTCNSMCFHYFLCVNKKKKRSLGQFSLSFGLSYIPESQALHFLHKFTLPSSYYIHRSNSTTATHCLPGRRPYSTPAFFQSLPKLTHMNQLISESLWPSHSVFFYLWVLPKPEGHCIFKIHAKAKIQRIHRRFIWSLLTKKNDSPDVTHTSTTQAWWCSLPAWQVWSTQNPMCHMSLI